MDLRISTVFVKLTDIFLHLRKEVSIHLTCCRVIVAGQLQMLRIAGRYPVSVLMCATRGIVQQAGAAEGVFDQACAFSGVIIS